MMVGTVQVEANFEGVACSPIMTSPGAPLKSLKHSYPALGLEAAQKEGCQHASSMVPEMSRRCLRKGSTKSMDP